jgi:hypothetical protein
MTKMKHPNGKVFESSCPECNKNEWVKEITRLFHLTNIGYSTLSGSEEY